ncbi:Hypothetical protein I5071_57060 [Sandaracinus amylolyticus]|nr:Hypothetical protein I5071_57060 [Sandaracinus amylolyticus]
MLAYLGGVRANGDRTNKQRAFVVAGDSVKKFHALERAARRARKETLVLPLPFVLILHQPRPAEVRSCTEPREIWTQHPPPSVEQIEGARVLWADMIELVDEPR